MPLADVLYKKDLTRDDLIYLLSLTDADEMQALYDRASGAFWNPGDHC